MTTTINRIGYNVNGVAIPYTVIHYDAPRKGIFACHTGEYDPENGWIDEPKELTIIGEKENYYIEREQPFSYGWWVGNTVKTINTTVEIGPHKSRLIKWMDTQLKLF